MTRRAKGTGSIYKLNKDAKVWWVKYRGSDGRTHCESTRSERKGDAQALLTSRLGDIQRGVPITPKVAKLTFNEAADNVIADFEANGKRSLNVVERRLRKHLRPVFGQRRMVSITGADVVRFVAQRQAAGASNGEINRELQILKRAYRLAIEQGLLTSRPTIKLLHEDNIRTGFFEPEQLEAVLRHLPAYIVPVIRFASITGWRVPSEVLPLEWRLVDFAAGEVRLDPGTTKNNQGRVFPFTAALRQLLEEQRAEYERLRAEGRMVPWVFSRDGERIYRFERPWRRACRLAGCPGRIVHDLRRSAVRTLVRAGIPERVCMKLTGHLTPSVFQRYNITSDGDLRDAARKLDAGASQAADRLRIG